MLRYFFSLILLFIASTSIFAQWSKWLPSAVRVGTDAGALGYMFFSEQRSFFEVEGDIDFNNFFVVMDLGVDNYKINELTYNYNNNGQYLRMGLDVNLMPNNIHQHVAFFGLRYGATSFDDKLEYDTRAIIETDTGWPNTRDVTTNTNATGSWFEMNTGLKVRVFKQLYLGFTARYKFGLSVKATGTLRPYYVPGFGKNVNSDSWGISYYVFYRLPFRKKVVYKEKKQE